MDHLNKQPTMVDLLNLQRVPVAHKTSQIDGREGALMDVWVYWVGWKGYNFLLRDEAEGQQRSIPGLDIQA